MGTPCMTATPDVIAAAQAQIASGFAVFALGIDSKTPVTEHGFKNATRDPAWVGTQLSAPSAGNYGMVWPEDAERRVVTFDLDDGGGADRRWQDRLLELMGLHGRLPRTKATNTPSGGRHAFFGWPAGVPIPPGDELFGFTVRWPGRGYLVGPGSRIGERRYEAGDTEVIADLPPAWVEAALAERRRPAAVPGVIAITGSFELPERIESGRRYAAVRDYVASRYNAMLSTGELWELVRSQVAPRFAVAKTEAELRADFDRATAHLPERLGPPAALRHLSPAELVAAASPVKYLNLARVAVEAVPWLWHRYLPVGSVTLFDGNPGEGKSTIVADLIARITTGGAWPDGEPVGSPGTVLYVTKEDDPASQVRPRIEAAGGDVERVLFVGDDLVFPSHAGRFGELLAETTPRLVLLDPLMSYLEGKVRAISDNDVRSAIMTPLAALARDVACAILVIRHFNKGGTGQQALMRGAGSLGGLAGAARMVLALTGDPESEDERDRVFGVVKSNYEAKPPSLRATIESAPVEGFLMTVSRVAWHGASTTSVSELMERTREQHQAAVEAQDDLRGILEPAGTEVPRGDVFAKMQVRKHPKSAIYAAQRALGVVIRRTGFPSVTTWALPTGLIRAEGIAQSSSGVTTGTTDSHSRNGQSHETPTTGMTGTTGDLQSSQSSQSYSRQGSPPVRARAHEAPELVAITGGLGIVTAGWCYWPADHANRHRDVLTDRPWCEACTPELGPQP